MPAPWKRWIESLLPGDLASDAIVASWNRSAAAGLRRDARARFTEVKAVELERRLRASAHLVAAARPLLKELIGRLPGTTNVAYVTDRDGIVLASVGDAAQITMFGLSPGYDWSEAAMGTNGAGTALASGQPVAVVGSEHYLRAFENCTCTAAPLRAPDGQVIGALDVSSSVEDAHPGRLGLVLQAARRLEQQLRAEHSGISSLPLPP